MSRYRVEACYRGTWFTLCEPNSLGAAIDGAGIAATWRDAGELHFAGTRVKEGDLIVYHSKRAA